MLKKGNQHRVSWEGDGSPIAFRKEQCPWDLACLLHPRRELVFHMAVILRPLDAWHSNTVNHVQYTKWECTDCFRNYQEEKQWLNLWPPHCVLLGDNSPHLELPEQHICRTFQRQLQRKTMNARRSNVFVFISTSHCTSWLSKCQGQHEAQSPPPHHHLPGSRKQPSCTSPQSHPHPRSLSSALLSWVW